MNKIATYLNEHVLGEVSSQRTVRKYYSQDGSILSMTPELVVFPRVTNDIRKVLRFTWQLAEKGHVIGLTVRGNGTDMTGGAIGRGIIIDTSAHLNRVLQVIIKDRLAHVQAGTSLQTLNEGLVWNGAALTNIGRSNGTVGGAIAKDISGERGLFSGSVERLEVVLANGDVIETGKLNKHELRKKQGEQTFEGELYRKLDGLIEDNAELIARLAERPTRDTAGYAAIADIKQKDGSFNLTPLFVGSQGTLGVISEVVVKTDFYNRDQLLLVATVRGKTLPRELVEKITGLEPSVFELVDGALYAAAIEQGKQYAIFGGATEGLADGSIVYIAFNDFSERAQTHKMKRLKKLLDKQDIGYTTTDEHTVAELESLRSVTSAIALTLHDNEVLAPVVDGVGLSSIERYNEFVADVETLAKKVHLSLPLRVNLLTGIVSVYPSFKLGEVSEKQKVFRLMKEYADVVAHHDGVFVASGGEGRLKSNTAWAQYDDATTALYEQVRAIFDPYGTLNPGVKQKADLRRLIEALDASYDAAGLIQRGLVR